MKIYKYPLLIIGEVQEVIMPDGANILSIKTQYNRPVIWALVDPDVEKVKRRFRVFPTGARIKSPETMKYMATVQSMVGMEEFVYHVFEVDADA